MMRFYFLIISLAFVSSAQAATHKNICTDMQVLTNAAQATIQTAMDTDVDDSVSDYLILGGDPEIEKANTHGKDLWNVPVVVDGEGCYGNVSITVQAGTCTIVGEPSFDGVSCTDN